MSYIPDVMLWNVPGVFQGFLIAVCAVRGWGSSDDGCNKNALYNVTCTNVSFYSCMKTSNKYRQYIS